MKIFGIGLSKTGTTSLTKALEILGYEAIHNPSYLLNIDGGTLSLDYNEVDRYDALTDIQMAKFYKELDSRYPGSKFILTTREVKSWLASCKNHFNQYRTTSEKVKALDTAMYGTDMFVSEKLEKVYFQHYNEVVEYFKGRNNDLLIIDILENDKWQKLCDFLNKPIPNESYPMRNKAIPIPVVIKNIIRRFSAGRKAIQAIKRKIESNN